MHAGTIITRYKTVHDGKTSVPEDQEQETKQQDATVWREGRLDDAEGHSQKEQAGFDSSVVFRCIVPRTRSFEVPTLKAQWRRAFHRVKGGPWDVKANAGDDVNDGGIPERVDARPPRPASM